jgi:hypothetical protein
MTEETCSTTFLCDNKTCSSTIFFDKPRILSKGFARSAGWGIGVFSQRLDLCPDCYRIGMEKVAELRREIGLCKPCRERHQRNHDGCQGFPCTCVYCMVPGKPAYYAPYPFPENLRADTTRTE